MGAWSSRKGGLFAVMLATSLLLGVALAAALEAATEVEEPSFVKLLEPFALPLALLAVMLLGGWRSRRRGDGMACAPVALARAQACEHVHPVLLDTMEVGILFLTTRERVAYCNPAFLRIWKIPPERVLRDTRTETLRGLLAGMLARPGEQARYVLCTPQTGDPEVKLDLLMTDGRLVTQHSHAVRDDQGLPLGRMWVYDDVTVERRNAKQLVQLAERDALTGQYNRHRFNEELARMLADAQRNGTRLALLFFNLDGFKYINESFGHRAGDAILMHVANEVASQVRRNEIFARLDGDQFAILVPDAQDDMLQALADRLTRSISHMRTEFEGQSLRITCSCGVAVYPDNAAHTDDLIACADAALGQAKEVGKNTWRIFQSRANGTPAALAPLSPAARVQRALEQNGLALHYQGVFDTRQRELRHYEVLLRVRDPESPADYLLPGEFVAMAERSGRMADVDRWVLGEAIKALAADATIPALAINISGRSLDGELPAHIDAELSRRGVPARRLLVELTETAAVSDLHDARRFIEALQTLGCGVCLDDFGTGFSSFAYLKHLPVDSIKIDGLFIRDLPNDRENQLFVRAMVAVARGLHKTTIAECVEDEMSLRILAALGVDYVQGFYLEAPRARLGASARPPGGVFQGTGLS